MQRMAMACMQRQLRMKGVVATAESDGSFTWRSAREEKELLRSEGVVLSWGGGSRTAQEWMDGCGSDLDLDSNLECQRTKWGTAPLCT